jgi:hypothetical protein
MMLRTLPLLLLPLALSSSAALNIPSFSSSSDAFTSADFEGTDDSVDADNMASQWEQEMRVVALNDALAWANRRVQLLHHDRVQLHHDRVQLHHDRVPTHRLLQSEFVDAANANRTTPEEICEGYNNQTEITCSCSRYGKVDTLVDCSYREPLCFTDNTTCFTPTFSQVLNANVESMVTTTCLNFTNGPAPGETCIRVFPMVNGTYNEIASCSAQFVPLVNGTLAEATDDNACHSCTLCKLPNTTVRGISLDCCNVQVDLKQTCGQVANESGASIPFFDTIPVDKQGQCKSGAGAAAGTGGMMTYLYYFVSLTLLVWGGYSM